MISNDYLLRYKEGECGLLVMVDFNILTGTCSERDNQEDLDLCENNIDTFKTNYPKIDCVVKDGSEEVTLDEEIVNGLLR
ncbi:MAG: hypothetical protein A2504_05395 [Bdellovibrionales bacterium RIFOXYD12_FULL_39_22]|nr:MAG: hypothetical protein A2385_06430 [Bdellovibrionales bacterium RIFOXYB1_FULL_39_21]OFZ41914.1 MAG: hypothetical protein A2485_08400 [Bdellovibrionales bacterium RIFOXYC12_FULL_39_17]OFZ50630.1 MAG: hypothetical protein A2404_05350 [Bdellovibrionales bacterium RIFOXYC1_FULL_39_130]OFZ77853.1 MAG: hypothetical protein A2560_00520 [Bdellovibrionales bacterium RIFOXYD1_FULL_39_84]OFZ93711.1 MAG: hypothetical protein A2504_05395 [Bdellovibrionales bacterium RIFOXYD12_FULL_39_22]